MEALPGRFGQQMWPMVWVAEKKITDPIFKAVNHWHQREDNIMQSRGQDCCQDITAREPCEKNCQQGLETKERAETEENTNRHTAGNSHRRVTDGQQLQRMFMQPAVWVHAFSFLNIDNFEGRVNDLK